MGYFEMWVLHSKFNAGLIVWKRQRLSELIIGGVRNSSPKTKRSNCDILIKCYKVQEIKNEVYTVVHKKICNMHLQKDTFSLNLVYFY